MEKITYVIDTCQELNTYINIFFQTLDEDLNVEEKSNEFIKFLEDNGLTLVPEVITVEVKNENVTQEELNNFNKAINMGLRTREPLVIYHDDRIALTFQKVCEHMNNVTREQIDSIEE
jgi:hypothetical protein